MNPDGSGLAVHGSWRQMGLAAWLVNRLRGAQRPRPRLALIERIAIAPRQTLALVEAEGRRLLVATSTDGGPVFYPLDEARIAARPHGRTRPALSSPARARW